VNRGELYLVKKPGKSDPTSQRVFVLVGRQVAIDSRFTTAICAPVYSRHDELSTQVRIGPDEGLKHESSIHCDELISVPKSMLTNYVGRLATNRIDDLNRALMAALQLDEDQLLSIQ
jgi:mRNA interferase MazF